MSPNRCNYCGSTNLRADRALAGRIICNECGIPAGTKTSRFAPVYNRRIDKTINFNMLLLMIFILVIIFVIYL